MADQRLGIVEAVSPTQYVDNEVVTNDQILSALRQKIATPDATLLLFEVAQILSDYLSRKGQRDPILDADRCTIVGGTLPNVTTLGTCSVVTTVTTLSTCTSVTALQNVVQVGGLAASNDQLLANRAMAMQQISFGIPVT